MEGLYLFFICIAAALCSPDKLPIGGPVGLPGGLRNVSKDNPWVQKAVLSGVDAFNNQSNDTFLFKASAIDSAQRQIVKGILYHLDVEISRTVCRKSGRDTDLTSCKFQPKGPLQQTFLCFFKVWSIPWLKMMTTTFFLCSPSDKLLPLPYEHQSYSHDITDNQRINITS